MSAPALAPVSARYGAPMGRPCRGLSDPDFQAGPDIQPGTRFYLHGVRVNAGGYDGAGAYWGLGQKLWRAVSTCGRVELFFRAADRQAARSEVRKACSGAVTFFR